MATHFLICFLSVILCCLCARKAKKKKRENYEKKEMKWVETMVFYSFLIPDCKDANPTFFRKTSNQISLHLNTSVYLYYGPGPVGTHTVGLVLDRSQADRNVTKIASVYVTPAIIPHGYTHDFTHQKKLDKAFFGSRWSRMKSDKLTQVM